jgi:hypothetical protein
MDNRRLTMNRAGGEGLAGSDFAAYLQPVAQSDRFP